MLTNSNRNIHQVWHTVICLCSMNCTCTDWNLSCFLFKDNWHHPKLSLKEQICRIRQWITILNSKHGTFSESADPQNWMIYSWFRLIPFSSSTHWLNNPQQITAHLKIFALMVPWKIITFAQKVLYGEKKVLQIFQMFFALRRKGSLTC